MAEVTAFVIAGGKSSRMGQDKAFLEFRGRSLLANALELARTVAPTANIVGPTEKFSAFGEVVQDIFADRGPLGGIHAALTNSATDLNIILGVDLPFIESRFLHYMLSTGKASPGCLVTVPRLVGGYEPLCAVYRKRFAEVAGKALAENRNKIDALFGVVPVRVIEEEEFASNGFAPSMFRNVNTPEDWKLAQESWRGMTIYDGPERLQ